MPMDTLGPENGLLLAARDPAVYDENGASLPRSRAIAPGEVWLFDMPAGRPPAPRERGLIAAADVVVYDRLLADTMAAILPLGVYAEPGAADAPSAERCAQFARDGWRVVHAVAGNADTVASRLLASGSRRVGEWRIGGNGGRAVAVFAAPAVAMATAAVAANGLAG